MDEIPNLGMVEDCQMCIDRLWVDSDEHQTLVKDAWKKLYDEGYAIDRNKVDGLLEGESLVPTEVWMRAHVTS